MSTDAKQGRFTTKRELQKERHRSRRYQNNSISLGSWPHGMLATQCNEYAIRSASFVISDRNELDPQPSYAQTPLFMHNEPQSLAI